MLKPQVTWSKISRKSANQKLACFIPGKSRTRVNPWLVQIKLSQDVSKITMPGQKEAYRLYSSDGRALIDLLTMPEEEPPKVLVLPIKERFIQKIRQRSSLLFGGQNLFISLLC